MSEIITINIGGYGSRIGVKLLQKMQEQYLCNVENRQNNLPSVFYHENQKAQLTPRVLFADTDKRLQSVIGANKFNLDDQAVTCLGSSCRGLFPEGKYLLGTDMSLTIEQNMRKQAEKCDNLSGFIVNCSLGGGCGSGLGALYLNNILERNYPRKHIQSFNLVPEYEDVPMNQLQIYNTILAYHQHVESTNLDILVQNKSLEHYFMSRKYARPTFDKLNGRIVDGIMAHIAPYIYSGVLNTSQRKKATNIALFPRLKNILAGLSSSNSPNYIQSSFKPINRFNRVENYGKIYSSYIDVRDGSAFENQISVSVNTEAQKYGKPCEWIPGLFGMSIVNQIRQDYGPSAWNLINCQSSTQFLKKTCQIFTVQFRRKAYVYHYTSCGMDEMQFTQAESNCNDLICEYVPWGASYYQEQQQN